MKYLAVALLALTAVVAVIGDPTECYHCTPLDGKNCHSPPDLSKIGKQSCSDIPTDKNTTAKTVCYSVHALWMSIPITERGCYYDEMEGEDLCSYFKRTEASDIFSTHYTCKLCYEDNCNDQ